MHPRRLDGRWEGLRSAVSFIVEIARQAATIAIHIPGIAIACSHLQFVICDPARFASVKSVGLQTASARAGSNRLQPLQRTSAQIPKAVSKARRKVRGEPPSPKPA